MSDAVLEGVSGSIGGCIATTVTYPLTTIATHKITTVKSSTDLSSAAHSSTISQLVAVSKSDGISALYGGLHASLVGTTVSQGVYFYLYAKLRALALRRRLGEAGAVAAGAAVTVPESLLIASLAGAGNVLVCNPIWVVATRLQAHKRRSAATRRIAKGKMTKRKLEGLQAPSTASSSASLDGAGEESDVDGAELTPTSHEMTTLSVAREVWREYGLGGFWNGCGASLVMVINPTLQYALYEWLLSSRTRFLSGGSSKVQVPRPSGGTIFLLSALAKAGSTVVTYPMLTVKTRMMTARRNDADLAYDSIGHAIISIARREGVQGFYQGLSTRITASVLSAAMLLTIKEEINEFSKRILGRGVTKVALA